MLDPLTEARLVVEIETSTEPGVERDTKLFELVCGRDAIPRRRAFMERYFHVQDKHSSQWRRFVLNRPQREVEAVRTRLERAGKPVRMATLKSRQWGVSRYWLAASIEAIIRNHDTPALLIADTKASAGKHLEIGKRIISSLPYQLPLKRSNRAELVLNEPISSYVDIGSAEEKNPARGRTYRFLHATEPAFWDDTEIKVRSLVQAVPSVTGTTLSWESTANGFNWWHDFWWAAKTGKNDYEALFFPWYADPTFDFWLAPTVHDAHEISATVDDEELWLIEQGCDTGSLKWRRWAIANLCFGDTDSFHQEYPARPEEAFLSSGRPVFVSSFVMKALAKIDVELASSKPDRCDVIPTERPEKGSGRRLQWSLVPNPRGALTIWERPKEGRAYIIGADVADAGEGGDHSAVLVIDAETMDDVAEWHGNIEPRELGFVIAALGWIYLDAWVVPEINSFGVSTLEGIRDSTYPRILRRAILDSATVQTSDKLGWCTTRINKPVLVDEVRLVLKSVASEEREGTRAPRIRSKECLQEMLVMTIDDSGFQNAPKGKHDDRIIARGIAYHARHRLYAAGMKPEPKKQVPTTRDELYWEQFTQEMEARSKPQLAYGEDSWDDFGGDLEWE